MPAYARLASLVGLALVVIAALSGAQPAPRGTRIEGAPLAVAGSPPIVAETFRSARTYDAVALPVRLRIPALHVDAPLQQLGLQADGTIAVPGRPDVAGWFSGGPRPGQDGPAVILGHVDSQAGPGIFFDLYRLPPGSLVTVARADGTSTTFRVSRLSKVPKTNFPRDLVYGPTLVPSLRLVTCGGSFDATRRSYRDNVIAFADQS